MKNKLTKITFLGIDETSLGIGQDSNIVVAVESQNESLIKDRGHNSLKKSKDILREAALIGKPPEFPNYSQIQSEGVTNFHWTRARGGRFSLKELQHASIAHIIQVNGYKPKSTVIYLDAFYANYPKSQYLIHEYLHRRGFKIPFNHINIVGNGDRCVPLINYADLLAFQIGLNLNEQYKEFHKEKITFDMTLEDSEVEFDEKRVMIPLDNKARETLEEVIASW